VPPLNKFQKIIKNKEVRRDMSRKIYFALSYIYKFDIYVARMIYNLRINIILSNSFFN